MNNKGNQTEPGRKNLASIIFDAISTPTTERQLERIQADNDIAFTQTEPSTVMGEALWRAVMRRKPQ